MAGCGAAAPMGCVMALGLEILAWLVGRGGGLLAGCGGGLLAGCTWLLAGCSWLLAGCSWLLAGCSWLLVVVLTFPTGCCVAVFVWCGGTPPLGAAAGCAVVAGLTACWAPDSPGACMVPGTCVS